ncbi:MAG: hypothetical protein KBS81_10390, partial [Spirochaetales bacterium]|nr:hypothetical protein [Candidatus Physcosoma equi]
MDRSKYNDIQPYFGEDVELAKARIASKREYIGALAYMLVGNDLDMIDGVISSMGKNLESVHSYDDFQHFITAGYLIPAIV